MWSYKILARALGSALDGREPASLSIKGRQGYGALSRLDKVM